MQRNNKRLCKNKPEDVPLGEIRSDCFHPFPVEEKCVGEFVITALSSAAE